MSELSGYSYACSANETFDMVALAVYGNEKYAAQLLSANPEYVHQMWFTGGEILSLPVVEGTEDEGGDEIQYEPGIAPWKDV